MPNGIFDMAMRSTSTERPQTTSCQENAHHIPQGSVLCVADGEGRNSVFLATTGRDVSSVDISDVGVAKTKKLASEKGVSVDAQVGDLAVFDLGRSKWQGVVSIFGSSTN